MPISFVEDNCVDIALLFDAMGNPARLRVLCSLLANGERAVGLLAADVGLSQSALSQHLAKLRHLKIVATRREAQTVFYRVADPIVSRLFDIVSEIFTSPIVHLGLIRTV